MFGSLRQLSKSQTYFVSVIVHNLHKYILLFIIRNIYSLVENKMYSQNSYPFWSNGPTPGEFYNFPGRISNADFAARCPEYTAPGRFGTQRSSTPITTGSSVLGVKFEGGVMIAADNLVSYGSLARYRDVQRVFKLNEKSIMGAGGDYADFQSLKRIIDQRVVEDVCYSDDIAIKPKSLYNWLTRVLYNRRSRMNPFYLDLIIGGMENGVPFLGHVDIRGRAYEDNVIASGFGKHLALPIVREDQKDDKKLMSQDEAMTLLRKSMEILYYRDCRSLAKYRIAICTNEGSKVMGPFDVNENWEVAAMVKGY